MLIGVLGLQGGFSEHVNQLERMGVHVLIVKTASELSRVDSLILPGGESSALVLLAGRDNLLDHLKQFIKSGKPVWGTCAGLILLSDRIQGGLENQSGIGGLNVTVQRNAFGRQLGSFVQELKISLFESGFPGVFIRAPVVTAVGEGVIVLAKTNDGKIVAVEQANLLGTAFHPELTSDSRLHEYFVKKTRDCLESTQVHQ